MLKGDKTPHEKRAVFCNAGIKNSNIILYYFVLEV